ncbi:MAG: enoyl-CoA hydratase-related protein [Actinomycetota bacterium]|nr:enoyl-CoA hydratase-related protein [Actinomycetota bacterium]
MVADGPVLVERPGEGVAKLTLNNPPLNLVTLEMTERLIEAIDAREAERLGLVNEVIADEEALPRGLDVARSISRQPKEAVAAIKRGVRESLRSGREDSVRLTLELSDHLFRTEDCAEGIRAFLEKREPRFEGAPDTGYEGKV